MLKPQTPPRVNIDVLFTIAFDTVGSLSNLDELRRTHCKAVLARIAVISRRQVIAELHRSIWPGSYEQLQATAAVVCTYLKRVCTCACVQGSCALTCSPYSQMWCFAHECFPHEQAADQIT